MKKIFKLSSIALIALSFASCNDWLDGVENTSTVDDVAVFDTDQMIEELRYVAQTLNNL